MELKTKVNKETILKKGMKPAEQKRQLRLESYMDKESKAKTIIGLLQARKMISDNLPKDATFSKEDIIWMFKDILEKAKKLEKVGTVDEKGWRGKSSIEFIKEPNRVLVNRYKRLDKDEEPKKVVIELSKQEINACLSVLGKIQIGDSIESKQIFMGMSRILQLGHTSWDSGVKPFETDRILHNRWTTLLAFMETEELIKYSRRGKVKLLKDKLSIQEILN